MDADAARRFEEVIRRDGRYPLAAYEFLHRGLELTTRLVYGEEPAEGPRHVTGQQLCEGLRRLALEQWGSLAQEVLARWNIRTTRAFGGMVLLLVNAGLRGKRGAGRIDDFDEVYDFADAFGTYEINLDEESD